MFSLEDTMKTCKKLRETEEDDLEALKLEEIAFSSELDEDDRNRMKVIGIAMSIMQKEILKATSGLEEAWQQIQKSSQIENIVDELQAELDNYNERHSDVKYVGAGNFKAIIYKSEHSNFSDKAIVVYFDDNFLDDRIILYPDDDIVFDSKGMPLDREMLGLMQKYSKILKKEFGV